MADEAAIQARLDASPYHQQFSTRLLKWGGGGATIEFTVGEQHLNPSGIIHGGTLAGILDTACGIALRGLMSDDQTHRTITLNVSYLKPGKAGVLTATGSAVAKGRSIAHAEASVVDSESRTLARATAVFMTLPRAKGEDGAGNKDG